MRRRAHPSRRRCRPAAPGPPIAAPGPPIAAHRLPPRRHLGLETGAPGRPLPPLTPREAGGPSMQGRRAQRLASSASATVAAGAHSAASTERRGPASGPRRGDTPGAAARAWEVRPRPPPPLVHAATASTQGVHSKGEASLGRRGMRDSRDTKERDREEARRRGERKWFKSSGPLSALSSAQPVRPVRAPSNSLQSPPGRLDARMATNPGAGADAKRGSGDPPAPRPSSSSLPPSVSSHPSRHRGGGAGAGRGRGRTAPTSVNPFMRISAAFKDFNATVRENAQVRHRGTTSATCSMHAFFLSGRLCERPPSRAFCAGHLRPSPL